MENFAVWFDIPITNLERAMKFYSKVFGIEMKQVEMGPGKGAFFPMEPGSVSGDLVEMKENAPSERGTVVYLNGGDDLSNPLNRVEGAGGKIIQGKTSIGEHGFIAYFQDTEGNRVGLHSRK